MLLVFILAIVLFSTETVLSQEDTVLLRSVRVEGNPLPQPLLEKDSVLNLGSIFTGAEEAINNLPAISIKNYGITGFSSLSVAGLPSRFTGVKINGMELNTTMSGDVDLGILPAFALTSASLENGSSIFPFEVNFESPKANYVLFRGESSLNFMSAANYYNGKRKAPLRLSASYSYNLNHYNVLNNMTYPVATEKLNGFNSENKGFYLSKTLHLSKKLSLNLKGLYFSDSKNVMQSLSYKNTPPFMYNEHYNGQGSFLYKSMNIKSNTTISFSKHFLLYNDSVRSIYSHNNSFSTILKETLNVNLTKTLKLNNLITLKNEKAITNNYAFIPNRNIFSAYTNLLYGKRKLFLKIAPGIKTATSRETTFIEGSILAKYKPTQISYIEFFVSKADRYPTFNDLYWNPGGNAGLQPENVLTSHLSIKIGSKYSFTLTPIYTITKNEILWKPAEGSIFWTPANISETKRFSTIAKVKILQKISNSLKLIFSNSYTFTSAKDENGNNLIFTPTHKNNTDLIILYKKENGIRVNALYYGERFTTTDNTSSLSAFVLVNLSAFYKPVNSLQFAAGIKNLTNESYEYIPNLPMPLRYFFVEIKFLFNHKNQEL